jgi:hypothetical protein
MASSGLFDTSTGKIAAAFLPPSGGGSGATVGLVTGGKVTPSGATILTLTFTPTATKEGLVTVVAQYYNLTGGTADTCDFDLSQDATSLQIVQVEDIGTPKNACVTFQQTVNLVSGTPTTITVAASQVGTGDMRLNYSSLSCVY